MTPQTVGERWFVALTAVGVGSAGFLTDALSLFCGWAWFVVPVTGARELGYVEAIGFLWVLRSIHANDFAWLRELIGRLEAKLEIERSLQGKITQGFTLLIGNWLGLAFLYGLHLWATQP
jgi:hypothetical protein